MMHTPGITGKEVFDTWIDFRELKKLTGLNDSEAEEKYNKGFFQSAFTTNDKPFKDMIFSLFSIELFFDGGKEVYPVLGDSHLRATKAREEEVLREQEALAEEKANNDKIVKLNATMIRRDNLKLKLGL